MFSRIALTMVSATLISWVALAQQPEAAPPPPAATTSTGKLVVEQCEVTLIDEAKVPAQEAGQLISVEAYEGLDVEEGTELARLNDDQAKADRIIAQKEYEAAQLEAENPNAVQLAVATTLVARSEYDQVLEANRRASGTKSQAEVNMKRYSWEKAKLQISQSQVEQKMAGVTAQGKAAQVQATELNINRRRILAPINGKVVEVLLHKGEWANPGDPVLHIVRLDRLRVAGFIDAGNYSHADVTARAVELQVRLPGGRQATFQGKISFVSPIVADGKRFLIHAEVVNRQENDDWLLQPGLIGNLVIDLNRKLEVRAAAHHEQPAGNVDKSVR